MLNYNQKVQVSDTTKLNNITKAKYIKTKLSHIMEQFFNHYSNQTNVIQ
ncbi:hypothetical protein BH10BAC2_BH10BAC2_30160 [soil metagenome]